MEVEGKLYRAQSLRCEVACRPSVQQGQQRRTATNRPSTVKETSTRTASWRVMPRVASAASAGDAMRIS
ncbi:hypothetical protein Vau01_122090 [Virgisporangium aurantiacum]|uniref:Uncharacterized protein n=1 Tax=Virgisporangium aurantiacum TaxID=175570 RepID=A0A8J4E7Y5_9ACTN|nr:hypothetical protein Vau01_122090 [Virgisporangium aurantiacum]